MLKHEITEAVFKKRHSILKRGIHKDVFLLISCQDYTTLLYELTSINCGPFALHNMGRDMTIFEYKVIPTPSIENGKWKVVST